MKARRAGFLTILVMTILGAGTISIAPYDLHAQQHGSILVGYFEYFDYILKESNKDPNALPLAFTADGDTLTVTRAYGSELSSPVYAKPADAAAHKPRGFMVKGSFIETRPDGDVFRSIKKYISAEIPVQPLGVGFQQNGKKEQDTYDKIKVGNGTIIFAKLSEPAEVVVTKLYVQENASLSLGMSTAKKPTTATGVQFVGSYKIRLEGPIPEAHGLFMSPDRKVKVDALEGPTEREVLLQLLPKLTGEWRNIVDARLKELQ